MFTGTMYAEMQMQIVSMCVPLGAFARSTVVGVPDMMGAINNEISNEMAAMRVRSVEKLANALGTEPYCMRRARTTYLAVRGAY